MLFFGSKNLNKLFLVMKNWLNDFRSRWVIALRAKLMEEYLDVENNWFEENEELLVESSLFNED